MSTENIRLYRLTQKATNNLLTGDPSGQSTLSMSPITYQNNQQWQLEDAGSGYYRISYTCSEKFLDGNGQQLYLHDWSGGDYQLWQKVDQGNGFYLLVQKATGKVLDGNGSAVYPNDSNGGDYQRWAFTELPVVDYEFVSLLDGLYLDGDGKSLYMNSGNGGDYQKWRLDDLGNGYFRVVQRATGAVLDGDGAKVYPNNWNGEDYQQWQWVSVSLGSYGYGFQQKATSNWLQVNDNPVVSTTQLMMGPSNTTDPNTLKWSCITPPPKLLPSPRQIPYSQVSFAMAHDSHTATQNYPDHEHVPENVDQTQPVGQQLAGGIRTVRISSGTYVSDGFDAQAVILQHGDPYKWEAFVECVFGTLDNYLPVIRDFLYANPNEVITIIDEGDAGGYQTGTGVSQQQAQTEFTQLVADDYQDVLGSLLFTPAPNWYTLDQLLAGQWPTQQELIDKGQRVILFMNNLVGGSQFPWILPAYRPDGLIAMNFYDAYNGDSQLRPAVERSFFNSDRGPALTDQTPYLLNHQFTQPLTGRTESSQAYNKWTVGDLLIENTIRAWQITGNKPTFLNVDFYQGVWGATSYLIDLVNTLNQIDAHADAFDQILSRWAGRSIFIQDTQGGNYPQGLQMSGIYTIASAQSPALSLSLASDNSVQLQPTNSNDLHQQWQLSYNSPQAGIALLNRSQSGCYLAGDPDIQQVSGTVYGHYAGQEDTGWQIGYDDDGWWIRRSLDQDTHLAGTDDCDAGDHIQLSGWGHGARNRHFIFNLI